MSIDGLSKPAVPLLDSALSTGLDRLRNYSAHSSANLPAEKRDEELKKASQEFEALFVSYLLKVMRSTVPQSDEEEGSTLGKDTYLEMFDQEIGLHVARSQSLGIGEMLYRKLSEKDGNKPVGIEKQRSLELKQHLQVTRPTTAPNVTDSQVPQSLENSKGSQSAESLQPLLDLKSPVEGVKSSSFGIRPDPFNHQCQFHQGIDLAAPMGAQIHSAHAGTVIFSGFLSGYGNTVILEHENGYRTLYAHAAKNLVAVGEKVASKQVIGVVGSTGRSTGPHLHFELEKDGEKLDPLGYLVPSKESAGGNSI